MMTKEKVISDLFSKTRGNITPGLGRTIKLSKYLSNPHLAYPTINIAGTNGKGAAVSLISSILIEAGYKVGQYSSPHILDFNERIRVNGKKLSDEDLVEIYSLLDKKANRMGASFFEITTVLAFEYFKRQKVDIAILETGMGGRWDSTNICSPIATGITYVGMDHMEYLGNSIEEISREKAGIIKDNIPVVSYATGLAENIIQSRAHECQAPYKNVNNHCQIKVKRKEEDSELIIDIIGKDFKYINLPAKLPISITADTFALVQGVLSYVNKQFDIDLNHYADGFKNLYRNSGYIGRMTHFKLGTAIGFIDAYLDIAHNPDAFEKQTIELESRHGLGTGAIYIVGIMADKDISSVLNIIKDKVKKIIFFEPAMDRAASIKKLKVSAAAVGIPKHRVHTSDMGNSAETLLDEASYLSANERLPLIITGSFHTAEAFLPHLMPEFKSQIN